MVTKEDCLKMLNSIEQNVYGVYTISRSMHKKVNETVILNGEEIELKYKNIIPECIEYLKNMLGE